MVEKGDAGTTTCTIPEEKEDPVAAMGRSFYRPAEEFASRFASQRCVTKAATKANEPQLYIHPNAVQIDRHLHPFHGKMATHLLSPLISSCAYTRHNCSAGARCRRLGVSAGLTAGGHAETQRSILAGVQTRVLLHDRRLCWR